MWSNIRLVCFLLCLHTMLSPLFTYNVAPLFTCNVVSIVYIHCCPIVYMQCCLHCLHAMLSPLFTYSVPSFFLNIVLSPLFTCIVVSIVYIQCCLHYLHAMLSPLLTYNIVSCKQAQSGHLLWLLCYIHTASGKRAVLVDYYHVMSSLFWYTIDCTPHLLHFFTRATISMLW